MFVKPAPVAAFPPLVIVEENGIAPAVAVLGVGVDAVRSEVGGVPVTNTVVLPDTVPLALLQYTVYEVLLERGPVENDPVVPVPPPPSEEQEVALVDVQLIAEAPPLATEDGEALTVTVGIGADTHLFEVLSQDVPVAQSAVAEVRASSLALL
jgi:hypothetical protein